MVNSHSFSPNDKSNKDENRKIKFEDEKTALCSLVDERLEPCLKPSSELVSSTSNSCRSSHECIKNEKLEQQNSANYDNIGHQLTNINLELVNKGDKRDEKTAIPAPPPLPVHFLNKPNTVNCLFSSSCSSENSMKNNILNWEKIESKNLIGTLWEKVIFF